MAMELSNPSPSRILPSNFHNVNLLDMKFVRLFSEFNLKILSH